MKLLLCITLGLFVFTAVGQVNSDEQDDLDVWRYPTKPSAEEIRASVGNGPVFLKKPITSSSYAHRQGQLAVQLPAGAHNVQLKLVRHEDFVFGTAHNPERVGSANSEWYQNVTTSLFNALVPENMFKWPIYEQFRGKYQRAKDMLDERYIGLARAANFSMVRGHTLEWGKKEYLFWAHQLECDDYVAALKERVTRDVGLFKGKFAQYDVFNEVIKMRGMLDKCNLWDTAFPDAFKWAAAVDPQAQLCLNDISILESKLASNLTRIIKDHLFANNAPIHCIGMQAHFPYSGVNMTFQQQNLNMLASLGLDLYITEFSLFTSWEGPSGEPFSDVDEATQAKLMPELFRFWFSHPAVKGIFMWGWWDSNIWIPNAGIYNKDKTPKQAVAAIKALWEQELSTTVKAAQPQVDAAGWLTFKGFYGTYEYEYALDGGRLVKGSVLLGRKNMRQSLRHAV